MGLVEIDGQFHSARLKKWTGHRSYKWIFWQSTLNDSLSIAMTTFEPTANTTLKRLPERGSFDRATVNAILDEGFICHVGFVVDAQPFVIPTSYARVDDRLFIHGSAASRTLRSLSQGITEFVTVTLIDA